MALPPLPVELVEKIVQNADPTELWALSYTSRALQVISEPVLYSAIGTLGFRSTIHAMHSLFRPRRAYRQGYVRKLSINLSTWAQQTNPQLLRGFFRLIGDALGVLDNLDELHLIGLPPSEAWVLTQCSAQPMAFVTDIPPGGVLTSWLEKQRRMEVLVLANKYLAHWDEHVEVSSLALPNLRMICAKINTLQQLIPSRPVERVVLDFTLDNKDGGSGYEEMKSTFASSSRPIHTFGIHFRPAPRNHIITSELPVFASKDARLLETVTFLDIQVPTLRLFDAFSDLEKTVEKCPNLHTVRVTGRHMFDAHLGSDLQQNSQLWHAHCPSLSRTVFREPEGSTRQFALDQASGGMLIVSTVGSWNSEYEEYEYYSAMLQVALRS
ncbi:hypothetical protein NEOLEDRAFT_1181417 [Neolentinus lepideus HHB14362 ss-1]|uniref:F-box domain-containing protein n=1 Tax=Neolentinus lepideus HHB14362 ss-1 TaxID=1314782 RepID=A0A165Q0B5_9AGAM|nr:hypothetical protein NEOLEDRAFT_1181417 [Neolentinus lepideus HHB14362 ss-1]